MIKRGIIVGLLAAGFTTGCGNRNNAVPDTITVQLPDGTSTDVVLGAGVPSLASSTWEFFVTGTLDQPSGQSVPFAVITFGSNGELTQFDSNTIAPEIFGDSIHFDGESHATNQQGITYTAGTYGAETNDASGFTFEGRLTAFAAGFTAAHATITATGTFDANDPDTMTGELRFSVRAVVDFIPNANMDEGYAFIAHRVGG